MFLAALKTGYCAIQKLIFTVIIVYYMFIFLCLSVYVFVYLYVSPFNNLHAKFILLGNTEIHTHTLLSNLHILTNAIALSHVRAARTLSSR